MRAGLSIHGNEDLGDLHNHLPLFANEERRRFPGPLAALAVPAIAGVAVKTGPIDTARVSDLPARTSGKKIVSGFSARWNSRFSRH
jgi:hypothetical protein